jgi:hypothetical protein
MIRSVLYSIDPSPEFGFSAVSHDDRSGLRALRPRIADEKLSKQQGEDIRRPANELDAGPYAADHAGNLIALAAVFPRRRCRQ